MKYTILLSLVIGLSLSASEIDLEGILDRVQDEIETYHLERTEMGLGRSKPYKANKFSRAMGVRNEIYLRAVKILNSEYDLNIEEASKLITDEQINNAITRSSLTRAVRNPIIDNINISCSTYIKPNCIPGFPFRTINGECNNVNHPFWGASNIAQRRFIPARYADGVGEPLGRSSSAQARFDCWWCTTPAPGPSPSPGPDGACGVTNDLPNPRTVSREFHRDVNAPDAETTLMTMQFGQFLDHDVTQTPESEADGCCEHGHENLGNCFAVRLKANDPLSITNNEDCMEFTRSEPFCLNLSGQREQINGITSFVDASNVYGSDEALSMELRTLSRGLMKVSKSSSNKDLLPRINNVLTAGDGRALEMPALASIHSLFLREHNRIAKKLVHLRPDMANNDMYLYHRTRHIVGAVMQNIVYGEYLPVVLGKNTMRSMNLTVDRCSVYDPDLDPSVTNSFSTAAFRFGHSQIQGTVDVRNVATNSITSRYRLRDEFFETGTLFGADGNGVESILFGITNQDSQKNDQFITEEVTNFLRSDRGVPRTDLVARNIQRGRDHGLPSYNDFREFCGLPRACSWHSPPDEIPTSVWKQLSNIYNEPGDVELFPGGLAENPFDGGLVGRTFNCIMSRQFHRLKFGDRFFFTHKGLPFTPEALANIRSRKLADIMCDNTDITSVKENVFIHHCKPKTCSTMTNQLDVSLFI